jgi:hypothetical protein
MMMTEHTILIDKNIMVSMRDGVQLATDIYRLKDTSPTSLTPTQSAIRLTGFQTGKIRPNKLLWLDTYVRISTGLTLEVQAGDAPALVLA